VSVRGLCSPMNPYYTDSDPFKPDPLKLTP
jgi:hypothetical protein